MRRPYRHYRNSLGQRYCTLRYLADRKMLHIIWKGTATEESIEEVEKGILKMIRQFPCRSILNDVQDFFQAPAAYLAYLSWSEWDMKVKETSEVRCIANVLPPDAPVPPPGRNSTDSLEFKYFVHLMDAVEWLNQKKLT
ncbi:MULTISPECIES: hypothetical protein [Pontibacter]|uniref:SpoIIAA-like n=1 Tax=Pontibacter lucknowensis TaxID=1077936 RepID=A0A1N6XJU3_9BACT|nr:MULTISPECIES: hypothetical protein [Pontibacter]SIR02537.1 hypothetical protein SAMN05421545_2180 [Pontibacter lucknowensis]